MGFLSITMRTVQVIGKIPVEMKKKETGAWDMLSLSSHKFYGPKGIGALYLREGTEIDNYMHGGGQERKKRSRNPENMLYSIVGLGQSSLQQQILRSTMKGQEK